MSLAAAGKFFEGFVVFMTGVALPLIVRQFHIAPAQKGIVSAASLAGILFGAVLLGGPSDYFGRKRMFVAEMIIFVGFLALAICLFGLGLALGALAGTGVGSVVLIMDPVLSAWRWMYATALIPALAITIARSYVVESAHWLAVRGEHDEAERSVIRLLRRVPQYPTDIHLAREARQGHGEAGGRQSFATLFNARNRRATIFASVPWFIQDLSTYGIGIFTRSPMSASASVMPYTRPGGHSYPLVNYEYVVVSTRQASAARAAELRQFLLWAISLQGGNAAAYLNGVGFVALPDFIRGMSERQIGLIGPGNAPAD